MKQGSLSDYFVGVGAKILKGTEVDRTVSKGHELQGINEFRAFLGSPQEKTVLPVRYAWLSDEEKPLSLDSTGTWYDARRKVERREPEYRLYYPNVANDIIYRAKAGDTLFLCLPKTGSLLALLCGQGSSIEQQLLWLFGLKLRADNFITQNDLREDNGRALDFTARYILELIGVEVASSEDEWLGRLLKKFGKKFPSTRQFSMFARKALTSVDSRADPDGALIEWMDFEERLFRTLERHIVGRRLETGFMVDGKADVDSFVSFSLHVQNRRKSRVGWAFGNHVEAILQDHNLHFKREATTEKRSGPDFLFPSEVAYHSPVGDSENLTMLGVKTTCKDRWRQVLAEADKIANKHLLTLEPGISETQTTEMQRACLQLVLPKSLHATYREAQRSWLMGVREFLELVKTRQATARH